MVDRHKVVLLGDRFLLCLCCDIMFINRIKPSSCTWKWQSFKKLVLERLCRIRIKLFVKISHKELKIYMHLDSNNCWKNFSQCLISAPGCFSNTLMTICNVK